jgi:uncharacterized membrane protein
LTTPTPPESETLATTERGGGWRAAALGLTVLGLGLSSYLTFVALAGDGRPAGCGEDTSGGCAAILAGEWSRWFGVPVAALAVVVYAAAGVGLFMRWRGLDGLRSATAVALLGAAVWFVGLQALHLEGWCAWCTATHGVGAALGVVLLMGQLRSGGNAWTGCTVGALGVVTLIGGQLLDPPPAAAANPRQSAAAESDGQTLTLLDGRLTLDLQTEPIIRPDDASADAPLLIKLFDYACPHCRSAHEMARELDGVSVLLVPVPLSPACNPYQKPPVHPRLRESCDLAKLTLAVHAVDPAALGPFHDWVFAEPTPPTYDAALEYARTRVDPLLLKLAWQDPRHDATLRRNVEAWGQSRAAGLVGGLPIHLSASRDSGGEGGMIAGPVGAAEDLRRLLDLETTD